MVFPLFIFFPNPQFLYSYPSSHFPPKWITKYHVNIQLSTKVCHILTKKSLSPFTFSFFPFLFFLLLHFVPHCLIIHFFPQHHSPTPSHSILKNIYPCNTWKGKLTLKEFSKFVKLFESRSSNVRIAVQREDVNLVFVVIIDIPKRRTSNE